MNGGREIPTSLDTTKSKLLPGYGAGQDYLTQPSPETAAFISSHMDQCNVTYSRWCTKYLSPKDILVFLLAHVSFHWADESTRLLCQR